MTATGTKPGPGKRGVATGIRHTTTSLYYYLNFLIFNCQKILHFLILPCLQFVQIIIFISSFALIKHQKMNKKIQQITYY